MAAASPGSGPRFIKFPMATILQHLPAGGSARVLRRTRHERRVADARGAIPTRTPPTSPARRSDCDEIAQGEAVRRREAVLVECARNSWPRASPRSSVARSTSPGGITCSTPRRSVAPSLDDAGRGDEGGPGPSGATAAPSRATTSSASATACSPTRPRTKPWLDQRFIDELGGRKGMSEYLVRRGVSTTR